jgi:hypothetical protein
MARSRNIKPGFFTNDVLGELPALTRLLFAGIWTICDREGRLEDRPKKIRAEILPYDQCDADEMLTTLDKAGFIKRYEVDGVKVIQVLAWTMHQNPHMKEAPSTLPVYVEHQTSTIQEQCSEQPLPERAGLIPSLLIPDSLNLVPDSLSEDARAIPKDLLADFLVVRKAKKAGALTKTAIKGIQREADKAGLTLIEAVTVCCELGWQGFNANWYAERQAKAAKQNGPTETTYQRSKREQMERDFPNLTNQFKQGVNHVAAIALG